MFIRNVFRSVVRMLNTPVGSAVERVYITDQNGFLLADKPSISSKFGNVIKNPVSIVDANGFPVKYNNWKLDTVYMTDHNGFLLVKKPFYSRYGGNAKEQHAIVDSNGFLV